MASIDENRGGVLNADAEKRESIIVSVRLRPLNELERSTGQRYVWEAADRHTLEFTDEKQLQQTHHLHPRTYPYDRVFSPECTSSDVYRELAEPVVESAMHGLNATIFAYGQTGSGKTYTMRTVMRMAAEQIFGFIREAAGREFLIRVSAIEIYNEVVQDLLVEEGQGLRVLDDPDRGPVVEGLSEEGVCSKEHLEGILRTVEQKRQVRETRLNDCSSRSHTILRLYVESRPVLETPEPQDEEGLAESPTSKKSDTNFSTAVTISVINFVDLAGSERSKESSIADPDEKIRLKEGCHINRSLLSLGTVIRSLGDPSGKRYVPYRDSRLTRILQPSLSGNARMAIICTISPSSGAVETTRAALHFATCAKRVTMHPRVNEVVNSKALLKKLQAEIAELRRQLRRVRNSSTPQPPPTPEVSELSAALRKKEEEVRTTAESRDILQKRLTNLEILILKAEPGSVRRRASWSHEVGSPQNTSTSQEIVEPLGSFPPPGSTFRHGGTSASVRSSWSLGASYTPYTGSRRNLWPFSFRNEEHRPLLLDYWLSPAVRKRLLRIEESIEHLASGGSCERPPPPRIDIQSEKWRLEQLEGPKGEEAEEALAALQAEVRCIKHSSTTVEELPAEKIARLKEEIHKAQEEQDVGSSTDGPKDDVILALKSELERLERAENANQAAARALDSLEQKINTIGSKGVSPTMGDPVELPDWLQAEREAGKDMEADVCPRPGSPKRPKGIGNGQHDIKGEDTENQAQGSVVFEFSVRSPSSSPNMGSPDLVPRNQGGCQSLGSSTGNEGSPNATTSLKVTASAVLGARNSQSEVSRSDNYRNLPRLKQEDMHDWYTKELQRLQIAFRSSAEEDLSCLRDCVKQYQDEKERLDCQKKLLLNQVLKLEFRLEEESQRRQALEQKMASTRSTMQQVIAENNQLRQHDPNLLGRCEPGSSSSSGSIARPRPPPTPVQNYDVREVNMFDRDSWADAPTVETLLPKIVQLWAQLHVPLIRRSRFLMAFRGREVFYYEAEHRRLLWERSQLLDDVDDDLDVGIMEMGKGKDKPWSKKLDKAAKRLEWERRWLAVQLKWEFREAGREELFQDWGIPLKAKERKMKLVRKLWDEETVRKPDGMLRSAALVLRLHGSEAQGDALEMVFRPPTEDEEHHRPGPGILGRLSRRLSRRHSTMTQAAEGEDGSRRPSNGGLWGFITPRRKSMPIEPPIPK